MKNWIAEEEKQQEVEQAFKRLCELLENSDESPFASQSCSDLLRHIQVEYISMSRFGRLVNPHNLLTLLGPTGALQEISIDNGWGQEYLRLAEKIEQYVNNVI
jgi:hypothetical protein